jgi:endonuclease III
MAKRPVARSIPSPTKTAAETRRIMAKLGRQHPNADTELHFTSAYELLVATILSAQCTDERVNQVTPALFRRYPDARALATASTGELEPQIQSTGFFRAKSRSLLGMATAVVDEHGGEVPTTMEELVKLPGVGRKTANVVLGNAFGRQEGVVVDTHVRRLSGRLGLTRETAPAKIEDDLIDLVPTDRWTDLPHLFIYHGRAVCKAPRALCDRCVLADLCPSAGLA